jgi:hypothetical protein
VRVLADVVVTFQRPISDVNVWCGIGLTGGGRRVLPATAGGSPLDGTDDSTGCAAIRDTRASTWMPEPFRAGSSIERAHHAERAAVHDVRVDHRRPHVLVAEQGLDGANVRARLQEVRGEALPQRMRSEKGSTENRRGTRACRPTAADVASRLARRGTSRARSRWGT